jgi:hypothetical protein
MNLRCSSRMFLGDHIVAAERDLLHELVKPLLLSAGDTAIEVFTLGLCAGGLPSEAAELARQRNRGRQTGDGHSECLETAGESF